MRLVLLSLMASTGAFAQLSFGVRGGLPLTDFFHAVDNPGATFRSDATQFVLGPTIELHLPWSFGVEFDALYRRFHYKGATNAVDQFFQSTTSNAWEFPLLLKYRTPGEFVRPYLDGGVTFDRWSGVNQVTSLVTGVTNSNASGVNTGFVVGGGIELHVPLVKISPEVRYTRWGAVNITDLGGALRSNQNQVEILIGVTF
jgi:opacity protein-like surface antigen